MALPRPPAVIIRVVREDPTPGGQGFLGLRRCEIAAERDGVIGRSVPYDVVTRRHLDAVVVAPHFTRDGEVWVILRSCVRPPIALRGEGFDGNAWELPGGLIEGAEEPRACAARELFEEIGASVPLSALEPLGHVTLPCAGLLAERHHFFHVVVDPDALVTPPGDHSPLEEGGALARLPLREALEHARAGLLPDAKTELGLRRLAEILA